MPSPLAPRDEVGAVAAVAVSDQVARLAPPGSRLDQLPPDPGGRGMSRHVDVHDAPAVVGDEDHDVERAHSDCLHRKQVDRPDVRRVVPQERTPGLQWRSPSCLIAVAAHGAAAHRESQGAELSDDADRSPTWILARQAHDQLAQLRIDPRTSRPAPAALPSPVLTPSRAVPADHRLRLHQPQPQAPRRPGARNHRPEQPVFVPQPWSLGLPRVDLELLTQDEILH